MDRPSTRTRKHGTLINAGTIKSKTVFLGLLVFLSCQLMHGKSRAQEGSKDYFTRSASGTCREAISGVKLGFVNGWRERERSNGPVAGLENITDSEIVRLAITHGNISFEACSDSRLAQCLRSSAANGRSGLPSWLTCMRHEFKEMGLNPESVSEERLRFAFELAGLSCIDREWIMNRRSYEDARRRCR